MRERTVAKQINTFWDAGEILPADKETFLRRVKDTDRDDFFRLYSEHSVFKHMLKEKMYRDMVWEEYTDGNALMFTIEHGGEYVGYCGIKDLTEKPWELCIEIRSDWTNHGLGRIAIPTMLNGIKLRLGVKRYRVRIEPTNYPSQKLFEGLGAVPNGISELWIHDKEALKEIEEDNIDTIDEALTLVAKKFRVEPRKLLSHVLECKLKWA